MRLNHTFEELLGTMAVGTHTDRLTRWPTDGAATPSAMAEGAFVVRHARLVQLLAAAAPQQVSLV